MNLHLQDPKTHTDIPELDNIRIPTWFQGKLQSKSLEEDILDPSTIPESSIHEYLDPEYLETEKAELKLKSLQNYVSNPAICSPINQWVKRESQEIRNLISKIREKGKQAALMKSKFEEQSTVPKSIFIKVTVNNCDRRMQKALQKKHNKNIQEAKRKLIQDKLDVAQIEIKLFQYDLEEHIRSLFHEKCENFLIGLDIQFDEKPDKLQHFVKRWMIWKSSCLAQKLLQDKDEKTQQHKINIQKKRQMENIEKNNLEKLTTRELIDAGLQTIKNQVEGQILAISSDVTKLVETIHQSNGLAHNKRPLVSQKEGSKRKNRSRSRSRERHTQSRTKNRSRSRSKQRQTQARTKNKERSRRREEFTCYRSRSRSRDMQLGHKHRNWDRAPARGKYPTFQDQFPRDPKIMEPRYNRKVRMSQTQH